MSDLKRCPLCKGKANDVRSLGKPYTWAVYCVECGCTVSASDKGEAHDKWNRRADDDNIDRQTIIDIINRHEYQLSDGFGYYGESSQAVCDIADEILEAMRPLPNPPRKNATDGQEDKP